MSLQSGRQQRKYKPTYFYSVLSVGVVLFLFGIFGLLIWSSENLSNYFKENVELSIELTDQLSEANKIKLHNFLDKHKAVKSTEFISKEMGAKSLMNREFENFEELLGFNPLYNSFKVYLNASYTHHDSLTQLKNSIIGFSGVKSIMYDEDLLTQININTRNASFIILALAGIVLLITLTLINSTVRLSMYSQRFLIKSMQLVGAKSGFIIKPFIAKAFTNGLMSGMIGSLGIMAIIYYLNNSFTGMKELLTSEQIMIVLGAIMLLGILITTISSWFAVKKYIKMKLDELY